MSQKNQTDDSLNFIYKALGTMGLVVIIAIVFFAIKSADFSPKASVGSEISGNVQEVRMIVSGFGYNPAKLQVKKGIPVRWVINVTQLAGCNQGIMMPQYNIRKNLSLGENIIEFTPQEDGTIPFSCFMGMIRGSFSVVG